MTTREPAATRPGSAGPGSAGPGSTGPASTGPASTGPASTGSASTDANAAYAAGIPAVALGVTRGEGEHTPEEWIETAPVADGLGVLAETIRLFREGQR